jgi:hypothetical protein
VVDRSVPSTTDGIGPGPRQDEVVAACRRLDRWDALIVGCALLAALARPLTTSAVLAVAVPGVLLLALRVRRPVARPVEVGMRGGTVAWSALAAGVAAWWLVAFTWGNDANHPTLSLLLDPVFDTYPGRLAGWLAWLCAGRWLVTR